MCKVTLNDVKKLNSIYEIPKTIHVNREIVLDSRLFQTLQNPSDYDDNIYDFDCYLEKYGCNLQRGYVWEGAQQREFITSILLDKAIEPMVVVRYEKDILRPRNNQAINYVIDGKQRLMTIQKFIRDEFPIVLNGKDVYYSDFSEDLKRRFYGRVNLITGTVYYSYPDAYVTDDMKIKLFNYYNFAGTPQTEEHKNKLQSLLEK